MKTVCCTKSEMELDCESDVVVGKLDVSDNKLEVAVCEVTSEGEVDTNIGQELKQMKNDQMWE